MSYFNIGCHLWDYFLFLAIVIDLGAMTKDIIVGDELPDWVGAKEFYQKYDPKEVIGRSVPDCP